jgi:hypothetical protein
MIRIALLIAIWLCMAEGKPCGIPEECQCYSNIKLISCVRQNLRILPNFGLKNFRKYDILDLRWNKIKSINIRKLSQFRQVDLRKNPLNCTGMLSFFHIKTDCIYRSLSHALTASIQTTLETSFGNRPEVKPDLLLISSSRTQFPSSSTFNPRKLTTDSRPDSTSFYPNLEETNTSSEDKMTNNPADSTVEFYLHVTLGPIGVLYVCATAIIMIRQYLRRRSDASTALGL